MASEAISLDDIVATLMSMGFEFQDCQDAITNGKLTMQAAIEWIIAGKPGNATAASQPTLKLNRNAPQTTNPFSAGSTQIQTPSYVPPDSDELNVNMTDDAVVSRSHMSNKQQQIKVDFEERERQEARRKVQEEKRKKKLEKERILKEIQEDREKQKLVKARADSSQIAESSQPKQVEAAPHFSHTDSTSSTTIQVRLPSGKVFRQTFSVNACLNNVWDSVSLEMKSALNGFSGFMQPFPRKEYSREDMLTSLHSLGLTPSGSLVLKKKDPDQATPSSEPTAPSQPASMDQGEDEENGENGGMEEEPQHQWGRGFRVEGEDVPAEAPQQEGNDDEMEGVNDDHNPMNPLDQMMALGGHPMFGGGGRGRPPHAFEGFGNRLVPAGVPGDNGRHLNRRAADMAAEAAAHRFAQPRPDAEAQEVAGSSGSHHELLYSPQALQMITMNILAKCITDPRCSIHSLCGLSNDLLQLFLDFLKREKLLKPKIVFLMPSYLLRLNLDSYPYTTNELLHSARVLVNLQSVSLVACPLITDSGLNALKGMKVLKSLNLQGCSQITDACIACFSELPSLQCVNLEGTGVTNAGITQLGSSGCQCHLLHLDLSRTSVTHAVIPLLANFTNLKSLRLKQSKVTSLSGIERITSLESLDISETDVVTDSILCLTRLPNLSMVCLAGTQHIVGDTALSYMQGMHLTSVVLPSRTTTTDIGLQFIAGFQLTSLDLTNYTQVGDQGMAHIGRLISLKTLLLTNTRVTDKGMQLLKGLTNLQVLFVDKTMICNSGAAVVQNFRQLAELSLAGTSITSDLLRQEALNNCVSLSKLNLSRTAVGDKGIQFIKLPNLMLLNLDCTRVHANAMDLVKINCRNIKTVTVASLSSVAEDE